MKAVENLVKVGVLFHVISSKKFLYRGFSLYWDISFCYPSLIFFNYLSLIFVIDTTQKLIIPKMMWLSEYIKIFSIKILNYKNWNSLSKQCSGVILLAYKNCTAISTPLDKDGTIISSHYEHWKLITQIHDNKTKINKIFKKKKKEKKLEYFSKISISYPIYCLQTFFSQIIHNKCSTGLHFNRYSIYP